MKFTHEDRVLSLRRNPLSELFMKDLDGMERKLADVKFTWPLNVQFDTKAALASMTKDTTIRGRTRMPVLDNDAVGTCFGGACTTAADPVSMKSFDAIKTMKSWNRLADKLSQRVQRVIRHAEGLLKTSPYAKAARACGFTFGDVRLAAQHDYRTDDPLLQTEFRCVCGRREVLNTRISYEFLANGSDADYQRYVQDNPAFDLARALYEHGSFSSKHLVNEDGYAPDVAAEIESTFERVLVALTVEFEPELKFQEHRRAAQLLGIAMQEGNRLWVAPENQ